MNKEDIRKEQKIRKRQKNRILTITMSIIFMAVIVAVFVQLVGFFTKEFLGELPDSQSAIKIQNSSNNKKTTDIDFSSAGTDTQWNLTLVNKWNPVPEHYKVNLVKVTGGEKVDERIYEQLMEMLEAAKVSNWNQLPKVVSGYRTSEQQQNIYDEKIKKYKKEGHSESQAKELAEQLVAVPGYGEHQLGLAVDINGSTYDLYFWLQENSYKYGFIFRYPGNKTEITGIAEEVWHYRYVGVEAAEAMYEQGLCLEEYLGEFN